MLKQLLTKIAIICLCFVSTNSWAGLQSDSYWEVRTTGSDNNGGCYDTGGAGTDYTQQDAAQLSLTDLATSGVGVTTLTSATGGFTEAMVDNCIQIRSGTNVTAGFYEVTAYTDTNTVTLDRAPDDGVGGVASGVGDLGGGLATIQKASDNMAACNYIYIKSGTYAETLTINGATCGTANSTSFIGYQTSRGDDPIGANRPVIDGGSARANCININGNYDRFSFYNLICQNATGTGITGSSLSTGDFFYNIRSTGNGAWGVAGIPGADYYAVEIDNNTSGGISTAGNLFYSYLHDNSGMGMDTAGGVWIQFSVADTNSNDGFETGNRTSWVNNVAYNNTGASSDGFSFNDNTDGSLNMAFNNISKDNGSNAFSLDAGGRFYLFDYNIYNGHTTELNGLSGMQHEDHNIGDVDPSFTNAAAGDFTVASGSPALDAGVSIDTYTTVTGDYKMNVGVDQDDNTAGGGSASAHTFVGGF